MFTALFPPTHTHSDLLLSQLVNSVTEFYNAKVIGRPFRPFLSWRGNTICPPSVIDYQSQIGSVVKLVMGWKVPEAINALHHQSGDPRVGTTDSLTGSEKRSTLN